MSAADPNLSSSYGSANQSAILHILVVDDDDDVRGVAVRQLASLGHRVSATRNGAEALSLLGRASDVDLLFVDLSMPNMGGQEVAEHARRLQPGLKILFVSGNFEGDLAKMDAAGATSHFIVKPYRKKDLAEKLQEVLGVSPT